MQKTNDTLSQLILVLGGARSGKSSFAEHLAEKSGRRVAFIATATIHDDDMRARVARHRASRPASWYTIEEPLHLTTALQEASSKADVIILDCMTLWLSNWLFAHEEFETDDISSQTGTDSNLAVLEQIDLFLQTCASLEIDKRLVIVTNEVGLGIVPAYPLGRLYRDLLGRVNQRLAVAAARVYLMVAGLAVDIKRLHEEAEL